MMQVSQGRAYKKTTDIMLMISIAFFLSAEDDQYCMVTAPQCANFPCSLAYAHDVTYIIYKKLHTKCALKQLPMPNTRHSVPFPQVIDHTTTLVTFQTDFLVLIP